MKVAGIEYTTGRKYGTRSAGRRQFGNLLPQRECVDSAGQVTLSRGVAPAHGSQRKDNDGDLRYRSHSFQHSASTETGKTLSGSRSPMASRNTVDLLQVILRTE